MIEILSFDKRIDQVWQDVCSLLIKHESDFVCKETIPSNADRKTFIALIQSQYDESSRIYKFTKLISTTNIYKKLYNVAKDRDSMCRIKYLETSISRDYYLRKLSSLDQYDSQLIKFWYGYSSSSLKELGNYLYDEFINLKTVKAYYFNIFDDTVTIKGHLISEGKSRGLRCPYCSGSLNPADPDHFLPKSKFPILSLYSRNIFLSCKNCNMGLKSDTIELPITYPGEINIFKFVRFDYIDGQILLSAINNERWHIPVTNYLKVLKIIDSYNNKSYCDIYKNMQKTYQEREMTKEALVNYYCNFTEFDMNMWDRKITEDFVSKVIEITPDIKSQYQMLNQ